MKDLNVYGYRSNPYAFRIRGGMIENHVRRMPNGAIGVYQNKNQLPAKIAKQINRAIKPLIFRS